MPPRPARTERISAPFRIHRAVVAGPSHRRLITVACYRPGMELATEWLGRRPYREAWARQRALVAARDADTVPDTLLLVEHDAVLTLGRHADEAHVLAPPEELARRGIEVIRVERGGEVTYHGPGQLVAYPIVRLRDRGLLLRPFVRALESAMADTAASYGVAADHGGAQRAVQRIPMVLSGPGLAKGATPLYPFRLVDLAPTVLDQLGLQPTAPVDGAVVPLPAPR